MFCFYLFSTAQNFFFSYFPFFFLFRSGVGESQHDLHLQRPGDEFQRWRHCRLRQPDVCWQWRGRAGRCLWKPCPGRSQWDSSIFPEQPEVTWGFCFPHHVARRDTASAGSSGGAATRKVKRDQMSLSSAIILITIRWTLQKWSLIGPGGYITIYYKLQIEKITLCPIRLAFHIRARRQTLSVNIKLINQLTEEATFKNTRLSVHVHPTFFGSNLKWKCPFSLVIECCLRHLLMCLFQFPKESCRLFSNGNSLHSRQWWGILLGIGCGTRAQTGRTSCFYGCMEIAAGSWYRKGTTFPTFHYLITQVEVCWFPGFNRFYIWHLDDFRSFLT